MGEWAASVDFSELARRILEDLVETCREHQNLLTTTNPKIQPCSSEKSTLDLEFISQMKKYREAKMVRQTIVVEYAILAPLDLNGIA